jgi:hypothetical protein
MVKFEATKKMRNNRLGRRHLLSLSNLISMALSDRYKEMKNRGRRLMKYRDEKK